MKSIKTAQATLGRLGLAVLFTALMQAEVNAAKFADFLFVVDESGSMRSEHDWLDEMIYELETKLQSRGLGIDNQINRYGLVGFGSFTPEPKTFDMDPLTPGHQQFGDVNQFAQTSLSLITNGGIEDGYDGIDFGLNTYDFRPGAAVNLVLVTDDYRDVMDSNLSFDSISGDLQQHNALLNVVINHPFYDTDGNRSVGVDAGGNAFVPEGDGFRMGTYNETAAPAALETGLIAPLPLPLPETVALPGRPITRPGLGRVPLPPIPITPPLFRPPTRPTYPSFYARTKEDYVELAWASEVKTARGAAWDLNMLRPGGNTVSAFTDAFTTVKADEAYYQTVPEPHSLFGVLLLGIGSLFARQKNREKSSW